VVYLEGLEVSARSPLRAAPVAPAAGPRMDQRNETFVPGVLSVTAGTVVGFPNNDETFHNVFSLSKPKRFDLGRYGRGKSKTVHFTHPGVVRVFCDIHSHMSAFVVVFNHPYHATTDDAGRYAIENIPAGTYTVETWHDGSVRDSRSVTITASAAVDLDLLVQ
jgi:plastocyanin